MPDFEAELTRIFAELDRESGGYSLAAECSPALDMFETDAAVEVVVDLPDVPVDAVRLVVKSDTLLIAGQKRPWRREHSSFFLMERGYGRFARTVRLASAIDVCRASAVLAHGELRVTLPKRTERRGQPIQVPVVVGSDS